MKNRFRTVALLVSFLLIFSLLTLNTGAAGAYAKETVGTGGSFVVPDVIEKDEAAQNGYTARAVGFESDDYTLCFRNSDGSYTMRVFAYPVKYTDTDGNAKDVSLELKEYENGYEPVSHYVKTVFPKSVSDGIRLGYGDINIRMIPSANTKAAPVLSADSKTVTYRVNESTDLAYSLTYAGFKEDIVVKEYTGQTEYSFTLFTNGLELFENEYGEFFLKDGEGAIKASIGDIIVFTADERNNFMGALEYSVIEERERYELTVRLNADDLSDPKTVYPIRIDPTIEVKYANYGAGAIEDVTIKQDQTMSGTSNSLYVGRHPAGALSRTLMRFPHLDLTGLAETRITEARVEIRDLMCQSDEDITIECHEYTGNNWSESGTTTWSGVGSNSVGTLLDSRLITYGNGNVSSNRYGFVITNLAKKWADGTALPSKGVIFKANAAFEGQTGQNIKKWYKTFSSYNRTSYRPSFSLTFAFDEFYSLYANTSNYYTNSELYNDYIQTLYYEYPIRVIKYADDGLQIRSNCYGYAMRYYYSPQAFPSNLQFPMLEHNDVFELYEQQPGEFADKTNGLVIGTSDPIYNYHDLYFLNEDIFDMQSFQDRIQYIEELICADAETLGYTITQYTGSMLPDARSLGANQRMIALVVGYNDFHFYMQHSDNTWSHKQGYGRPSNVSLEDDNPIILTNTTIGANACKGAYTGGALRFYIVTKNVVADYSHEDGNDNACALTPLTVCDYAGNGFYCSKGIANISAITGKINYPGDRDCYYFTPSISGTYTLTVSIHPLYLLIEFCDTFNNVLNVHTVNAQSTSFTQALTGGDVYIIKIYAVGQTVYNDNSLYSISINLP